MKTVRPGGRIPLGLFVYSSDISRHQGTPSPHSGSGRRPLPCEHGRGETIREGRQPTHHPQVFAPLVLSPFPWLFRGGVLYCASRRGS
ncbi:MAG: hypothetical protein IJF48_04745, partial [Clostridia bacterium]|nr:hypothetical protein [Clostridia bacterium]